MEFIDYYQVLNIDKNTSAEDVKKAYRKLAHKHHPDLNPTDKEAHRTFQRINEAYKVIGDQERRKHYDLYVKALQQTQSFQQGTPPPPPRQQAKPGQQAPNTAQSTTASNSTTTSTTAQKEAEGSRFSEFFHSLFGNRSHKGHERDDKPKGQDLETIVQLRLQDVYVTQPHTFIVGGRPVRLQVPAGVEDGQRIRVKGHGAPSAQGGSAGDLYVTFKIMDDPVFKRAGNDLHAQIDLALYTAILGGEITVDTFNGKLKLKVPPETQNGTKMRLKGKGFPVYKQEGQYGDLYITYQVKIPTGLSERERQLFAQLSQLKK